MKSRLIITKAKNRKGKLKSLCYFFGFKNLKIICEINFSAANKSMLKVAQYAAQLQQYRKAIDIYEEVPMLIS